MVGASVATTVNERGLFSQCCLGCTIFLKVFKREILISWILMIFYHEFSVGRGL
jgi:hypothetical protein